MDPQIKSLVTTMLGYAAAGVASIAASKGLIPSADQPAFTAQLVTISFGLIAAGIAWYKTRVHTPEAQIAAVNKADNGVKVVAKTALAPMVEQPIAKLETASTPPPAIDQKGPKS